MYAAIDIGGTRTRIGFSRDGRRFFAIEKFKTPRRMKDGLQAIVAHLRRTVLRVPGGLSSPYRIALAVPGSVDAHGAVHGLANLPDWNPKKLAAAFAHAFQSRFPPSFSRGEARVGDPQILIVNDADAAGLGEARRGAGKGYRKVAYFTLSTGVGGARLLDSRLVRGVFEPGHQRIVTEDSPLGARRTVLRKCGCGKRGCWESYASGKGFFKTYGMRPEHCRNKKIWATHAQIVGKGIISALGHWLPDVVVIGGGLSQAGSLLFNPLRAYVRQRLKESPPILRAKLGDKAGLYGCLELLKRK